MGARWDGRIGRLARVTAVLLMIPGCGGGGGSGPQATSGPGAIKTRVEFWHTRRGDQEKALEKICREFGRQNPDIEVLPQFQGLYNDLHKKVRASIQARALPALTVAYENHVTEYMANGVVRPLDDLVGDAEIGLSESDLSDIPEPYLRANRYPQFNNQLLSFPFTKSNLVMYCNLRLLRQAGFDRPPETWDEFERQSRSIAARLGRPAYAFTIDASTLNGMIMSHGGRPLAEDGLRTEFHLAPAVNTLALLQRMARAKTLVQVEDDDVGALFLGQRCAFALDTSSVRANMESQIGSKFDWDIAHIPHGEGVPPVTVMYGPNVCLFNSNAARERAAWKFVRYFTSPEVTARWARETGYLPVRASALDVPEMKEFYAANPRARTVYSMLATARGEPNVMGWQEVRKLLEDAARKAVGTTAPPEQIAADLRKKADRTLAQSR